MIDLSRIEKAEQTIRAELTEAEIEQDRKDIGEFDRVGHNISYLSGRNAELDILQRIDSLQAKIGPFVDNYERLMRESVEAPQLGIHAGRTRMEFLRGARALTREAAELEKNLTEARAPPPPKPPTLTERIAALEAQLVSLGGK
ncbi:MAG: hypothetical protein L3K14_08520 [Thermoplasmata archaeon]|nr:hypothetical protein [Thermoplasmata archaeon]